MSEGIDISKKCNTNCQENGNILVLSGFVDTLPEYGYITHKGINGTHIGPITYEGKLIKTNEGSPIEATVYYYIEYEEDLDRVKKPLFLRVNYGGMRYFYKRTSTRNTVKWENVTFTIGKTPKDYNTTADFTKQLKARACDLHRLHSVNIYKTKNYECACGKARVTIENTSNSNAVRGYNSYLHRYNPNVTRVKYRDTILRYNYDGDDRYDPIPLDVNQKTSALSVYYWDQDRGYKRPLLMEVYVGEKSGNLRGMQVPLGNDEEKSNKRWTIIFDNVGKSVSAETLHRFKCQLFRPVDIDINISFHNSGNYENKYCIKNMNICPNPSCFKVIVSPSNAPEGYAAFQHDYGIDGFTVTEFTNGPGKDLIEFPIWDVQDVVVFFSSCDARPLLIYVGSDGGKTRKWYSRTKGDNKWQKEEKLGGKNPKAASSTDLLVTTLNRIRGELSVKCKEERRKQVIIQPTPNAPVRPPSTGNKCSEVDTVIDIEQELLGIADEALVKAFAYGLAGARDVTEELARELKELDLKELLGWATELGLDASQVAVGLAEEALKQIGTECESIPAADLSDQVPDIKSETKMRLQDATDPPEVTGDPLHLLTTFSTGSPLPAPLVNLPHPSDVEGYPTIPPNHLLSPVKGDVIKSEGLSGLTPPPHFPSYLQGYPVTQQAESGPSLGYKISTDLTGFPVIGGSQGSQPLPGEEGEQSHTSIPLTTTELSEPPLVTPLPKGFSPTILPLYTISPGSASSSSQQHINLSSPQSNTSRVERTQSEGPVGQYTVFDSQLPKEQGTYTVRHPDGTTALVEVKANGLAVGLLTPVTEPLPGSGEEDPSAGYTHDNDSSEVDLSGHKGPTGRREAPGTQEVKQEPESRPDASVSEIDIKEPAEPSEKVEEESLPGAKRGGHDGGGSSLDPEVQKLQGDSPSIQAQPVYQPHGTPQQGTVSSNLNANQSADDKSRGDRESDSEASSPDTKGESAGDGVGKADGAEVKGPEGDVKATDRTEPLEQRQNHGSDQSSQELLSSSDLYNTGIQAEDQDGFGKQRSVTASLTSKDTVRVAENEKENSESEGPPLVTKEPVAASATEEGESNHEAQSHQGYTPEATLALHSTHPPIRQAQSLSITSDYNPVTHGQGILPGPLGPSGPDSPPGSDPTNIIVSVTTGILGTSALACFAGWKLYNRYKGDPWVRQI